MSREAKRSRFALFLRGHRLRKFGKDRRAAAHAAGLTPNQLSQFELGRTKPNLYQLLRICQAFDIDLVQALKHCLRAQTPPSDRRLVLDRFIDMLAASPELQRLEPAEIVFAKMSKLVEFANTTLVPRPNNDEESFQSLVRVQLELRLALAGLFLPSPYSRYTKKERAAAESAAMVVANHAVTEYAALSGKDQADLQLAASVELDQRWGAEGVKGKVVQRLQELWQRGEIFLSASNPPASSLRIGIVQRSFEAEAWYWLGQFLTLPKWHTMLRKCAVRECPNVFITRSSQRKWCNQHKISTARPPYERLAQALSGACKT